MTEVKIGIVGLSSRGRHAWLRTCALVPHCRVTAVCDRLQPLVDQAIADVGPDTVAGFTDYDSMLNDADIDAVAVVTEPRSMADLCLRALDAGKHVIVEVPLCYSMDDIWKLVLAVERTGLKFQLAEQVAWSPFVFAWRDMVANGQLGKVLMAEGQYLHGIPASLHYTDATTGERMGPERADDNPNAVRSRFWNLGDPIMYHTHDLSPLMRILDDRIKRVFCFGTRKGGYHFEQMSGSDLQMALMHTEKDTVIRLAAGFNFPTACPRHWYHLVGTLGDIETARSGASAWSAPGAVWRADQYATTKMPMEWSYTEYQPAPEGAAATGHGGLDFYPIEDFVRCIIDDREPFNNVYRAAEVQAPAYSPPSQPRPANPSMCPSSGPQMSARPGRSPTCSTDISPRPNPLCAMRRNRRFRHRRTHHCLRPHNQRLPTDVGPPDHVADQVPRSPAQ